MPISLRNPIFRCRPLRGPPLAPPENLHTSLAKAHRFSPEPPRFEGWRLNLHRDDGSSPLFPQTPPKHGLKNRGHEHWVEARCSVLTERENGCLETSPMNYKGKRMGGVCCREQAHVPEHMYAMLFVQAVKLCYWNHGSILGLPSDCHKTWPPPLSQKKYVADVLFMIHARMTP